MRGTARRQRPRSGWGEYQVAAPRKRHPGPGDRARARARQPPEPSLRRPDPHDGAVRASLQLFVGTPERCQRRRRRRIVNLRSGGAEGQRSPLWPFVGIGGTRAWPPATARSLAGGRARRAPGRFPPSCCRVWGTSARGRTRKDVTKVLSRETSTFREYLHLPGITWQKCACSLHWTLFRTHIRKLPHTARTDTAATTAHTPDIGSPHNLCQ